MSGSLQKSLSRMNRRRASRRHAAQSGQAGREVLRERRAQEIAKRRHRARRAFTERREALAQFFRRGIRIETLREMLRGGLQNPIVRRWAPRAVGVIAVVSLIGNILQYSRYSPWRPLVTVGHRVVRQREYMALLDTVAGKAVLNKVVYEELIQESATQSGVMPSPQDVDTRVADLKRRNPSGLPSDDQLWEQVRLQMALENLRMRGTTATDAEIVSFYNQHKAQFATPARAQTTLVATTNAADAARAVRLLAAGKSDNEIAALPGMHVAGVGGFSVSLDALPLMVREQVGQTVMALPIGAVKTVRVAANVFFTLKPQKREEGQMTPLPLVREEVARQVRLQKAPNDQAELASLYHANPPSFDMAKYSRYFTDVPAASAPQAPSDPKTASLPPADSH